VAGRARVAEFRDMLVTARDRMAAMVDRGMTEEQAQAAKPFADLDAKWAGNERDSINFVRMAYNSFNRS
jgi:cyclase